MAYTWKDIKLATLQKMFASTGTNITVDSSTSEYIYAMPQAANEGLQLLSTAGKFIIKQHEIVQRAYKNILGDSIGFRLYSLANDEALEFKAKGARSMYFKICGKANVYISWKVQGIERSMTKNIDAMSYQKVKLIFDNPDSEEVKIVIHAEYPTEVKNLAFYEERFENEDSVPDYERFIRYNLSEILDDFYQMYEIYYEGETEPVYLAATDYYQEADRTLVIPRNKPGAYTVYYKAYPGQMTFSTPDTYVMPLDPEVAPLLPLYMASELYKDDDNSIAVGYRNEFEAAFERLIQKASAPRKEEFTSESGW